MINLKIYNLNEELILDKTFENRGPIKGKYGDLNNRNKTYVELSSFSFFETKIKPTLVLEFIYTYNGILKSIGTLELRKK
jgi:hypothetical protein